MKSIFRLGLVLIVTTAFAFISCAKVLPNKVQKIVAKDDNGGCVTYYFNSDGKLSEMKGRTGSDELQYLNNEVTIVNINNGNRYNIAKIEKNRVESFYGRSLWYSSNNGYLSLINNKKKAETYSFTVKNKKLVKFETSIMTTENRVNITNNNYRITYGNELNNLNVDFSYLLLCGINSPDDFLRTTATLLGFSGLLGKRLKFLPSEVYECYYNEKEKLVLKYTYEYEGEYLTKIIVDYTQAKISYDIYY